MFRVCNKLVSQAETVRLSRARQGRVAELPGHGLGFRVWGLGFRV